MHDAYPVSIIKLQSHSSDCGLDIPVKFGLT